MTEAQIQDETQFTIDPGTRMGHVHYTVSSLERQVAFYRDILGFRLHWQSDGSAGLGAGQEDLLRLTEQAGARRVRGTTGLYHTAFLVPSRWQLAHLLKSIAESQTPIEGMTNHGTHHAIYLPDAEGNGIELAWDYPSDQWPRTLDEMMSRNRALPPQEVFEALDEQAGTWAGLDSQTVVGHVHLHVAGINPAKEFYQRVLGFTIPLGFDKARTAFSRSAMFYAAGDYHHHIGTNIWQGAGSPPPPPDATGLRYYSIVLPDAKALKAVTERLAAAGIKPVELPEGLLIRDPSHNGVLLALAAS